MNGVRSRPGPSLDLEQLIDALERAGVHGHGGAFFPTATKLRAVAAQPRSPVIVVNGSEGEPLSRKDRFLLSARTDIVLDGALVTARALGADTIVIAVEHRRASTIETLQAVLGRHPELGARRSPAVDVIGVPSGYVTGQETALINFLNGGEAKPTQTPPYPFEKGLRGRPTLVSNAETFAQIGRVNSGTYDAARCVTVSGAVARTAVVQVRPDTTVAGALAAAGGVSERPSAILLGGYGGTWMSPSPQMLDLSLDEHRLRAHGLTLGAGIIHVLGESRCGVAEVARVTQWMASQSAGQCGPCVFGLTAIADALHGLCVDRGPRAATAVDPLAQIRRWSEMVVKRGACAHPDGVARYVSSALTVMHDDFQDHLEHGPCADCDAPRWTIAKAGTGRRSDRPRGRTTV